LELTYTNRSADGSPALFIINRNGKNKRKILDDDVLGYYRGVWSPDGKWLVLNVEKLGDPPYLAIVKKDGTGFKKIPHTQGAMTPIWQPR
jgi:Tol biopolymer transport system component